MSRYVEEEPTLISSVPHIFPLLIVTLFVATVVIATRVASCLQPRGFPFLPATAITATRYREDVPLPFSLPSSLKAKYIKDVRSRDCCISFSFFPHCKGLNSLEIKLKKLTAQTEKLLTRFPLFSMR